MIRYTFTEDPAPAVIEVECAARGYPHRDASGRTQHENTHFDTWEEAHARLVRELESGIELASGSRKRLRTALEQATNAVADFAEKLVAAKKLPEERERQARLLKTIKETAA